MTIAKRIFMALYNVAQQGRLERAISLSSKVVKKAPCLDGRLAECLSHFCRQSITPLDSMNPLTLESLNRAGRAFREIRLAQAKGLDANLLTLA